MDTWLETELRAAMAEASSGLEPTPDLAERVRNTAPRRRRAVALLLASAAIVLSIVAAALAAAHVLIGKSPAIGPRPGIGTSPPTTNGVSSAQPPRSPDLYRPAPNTIPWPMRANILITGQAHRQPRDLYYQAANAWARAHHLAPGRTGTPGVLWAARLPGGVEAIVFQMQRLEGGPTHLVTYLRHPDGTGRIVRDSTPDRGVAEISQMLTANKQKYLLVLAAPQQRSITLHTPDGAIVLPTSISGFNGTDAQGWALFRAPVVGDTLSVAPCRTCTPTYRSQVR